MIGVDNEISPALLSELRKIPNILSLKILHLPSAQA
jgi:hypothetical protein